MEAVTACWDFFTFVVAEVCLCILSLVGHGGIFTPKYIFYLNSSKKFQLLAVGNAAGKEGFLEELLKAKWTKDLSKA